MSLKVRFGTIVPIAVFFSSPLAACNPETATAVIIIDSRDVRATGIESLPKVWRESRSIQSQPSLCRRASSLLRLFELFLKFLRQWIAVHIHFILYEPRGQNGP